MWTALLAEAAPTAPLASDAGGGSPTALIITAVCGGIAAIITAVSLLLRARRDDDADVPTGARPIGERVAIVEHELGDLRDDLEELRDLLLTRRPTRSIPTPRRSLTP